MSMYIAALKIQTKTEKHSNIHQQENEYVHHGLFLPQNTTQEWKWMNYNYMYQTWSKAEKSHKTMQCDFNHIKLLEVKLNNT